jgi:hypothetical protein
MVSALVPFFGGGQSKIHVAATELEISLFVPSRAAAEPLSTSSAPVPPAIDHS